MKDYSTSEYASQFYRIGAVLSILLAIFLGLSSTVKATPAEDVVYPEAIYIPVDDRPANKMFPAQLARIGGGSLSIPPQEAIGKAYTPGDTASCARWLENQVAAHGRCPLIVSADMLAYGGLLASRTAKLSKEQALANLQVLPKVSGQASSLYVYAMLPRLSLQTSEEESKYEETLANWAAKASYKDLKFNAKVPENFSQEYLAVRRRNIEVVEGLIDMVREGVISKLVLGQDDAHRTGLAVEEQQRLLDYIGKAQVKDKVTLVSGTDELGMCLVSGWLADYWKCHPSFEIVYSDLEAAAEIPALESLPLQETVAKHLQLCGGWDVAGMSSEVLSNASVLWIATQSDKPFVDPSKAPASSADHERATKLDAFLEWAKSNKRLYGVADVRLINRADPILADTVLKATNLWDLEGYAAWNTPSNTLGTAMSQMVVHNIARTVGRQWDQTHRLESEKTQLAFTWARLIDDYAYQALIRPTLTDMVKGLPRNPDPLLNLYGGAGMSARQSAVNWAEDVWQKRLKGRSYTHPNFGVPLTLKSYKLEVVLPWTRIFEIEARLDLRLQMMSAAEAKAYRAEQEAKDIRAQAEREAAERASRVAEANRKQRQDNRLQQEEKFKAEARARSAEPNKPKDRDQSIGEAVKGLFKGGQTDEELKEKNKKRSENIKHPVKAVGKAIDKAVETWEPVVKDAGPALERTWESIKKTFTTPDK